MKKKKMKIKLVSINQVTSKYPREVVNLLSGFSRWGTEPYNKQIEVHHIDSQFNEIKEVDFFTLFHQMPPFEPISYPETLIANRKVTGDRLWLINLEELRGFDNLKKFVNLPRRIDISKNKAHLIFGEGKEISNKLYEIKKIFTFSVLLHANGSLYVDFIKNKNRLEIMRIRYGIKKIRKNKINIKNEKEWNNLEKELKEKFKSKYSLDSLNYISFCANGKLISSDPFDTAITKCEEDMLPLYCKANKSNLPGTCNFHWRRQLFPKFYSEIKMFLDSEKLSTRIPFKLLTYTHSSLSAEVESFSVTFPRDQHLEVHPKYRPYTKLRSTNGIVLTIPSQMILLLLDILLNNKSWSSCLDVLLTKYFIVRHKSKRLDFDFRVSVRNNEFIFRSRDIEKFHSIRKNILESERVKLIDFLGEVLTHTLGHVLKIFVSDYLDIDTNSLIYLYNKTGDPSQRFFYTGIVEANEYGILSIDKAIMSKHNKKSWEQAFLEEFISFIYSENESKKGLFIKSSELNEELNNEKAIIRKKMKRSISSDDREKEVVNVLMNLAENLKKYLIKNDFVPDYTTFKVIFSNIITILNQNDDLYEKIFGVREQKEKKMVNEIIERHLEDVVFVTGPDYCLDGCSSDIFLEKECTKGIYENILTSKCLLDLFFKASGLYLKDNTFDVKQDVLAILVTDGARERGYIETTFTTQFGLTSIEGMIGRKIKVKMVIDERHYKKYHDKLMSLEKKGGGLFKVNPTDVPSHAKKLIIDDLFLPTSWNYGSETGKIENITPKHIMYMKGFSN